MQIEAPLTMQLSDGMSGHRRESRSKQIKEVSTFVCACVVSTR